MGCIILEFLVWLLYGSDELKRFTRELTTADRVPSRFFRLDKDRKPHVHDVVKRWMHRVSEDSECNRNSSLGDLVRLVEEKLLVINLSTNGYSPGYRADASTLRQELDHILQEAMRDRSYLFSGATRTDSQRLRPVITPTQRDILLTPTRLTKTDSNLHIPQNSEINPEPVMAKNQVRKSYCVTSQVSSVWLTAVPDFFSYQAYEIPVPRTCG